MLHIVELIAEAIRPDGGWVGVGESLEGSGWIVMVRLGQTAWIRSLPPSLALARFLEWGWEVAGIAACCLALFPVAIQSRWEVGEPGGPSAGPGIRPWGPESYGVAVQ